MAAEAERAVDQTAELLPQSGGAGMNSNQSAISSLSELIKWSATSQIAQGLNSDQLAPKTAQSTISEVTVMTSDGSALRAKKPGRKPRKATSVRNTMHTEPGIKLHVDKINHKKTSSFFFFAN